MQIMLASTSPFRRALLGRLGLPFACVPPEVDETPGPREAPDQLALRLALAKAQAVAHRHPQTVVIGSDQVAVLDGTLLGKPGDHTHAVAQLVHVSGRRVDFYTGLCVLVAANPLPHTHLDTTRVTFRTLTGAEIERYLRADEPYQCAGSFKSEALGISLCERIETEDPTALVGLPLIALSRLLRAAGLALP
ncbi:MAG: Maf family protein [Gammaproteobacteria bacterium]